MCLDDLCINTIRMLSVDAIEQANSGHPGLPMGAAPMAYVLWTRHLKHNPRDPQWPDRDRFVLSAGHGSMLLYSLLYLTGYDVSLDDLKAFRQWGSKTPGHPEHGLTPGVEVTTGPLGQGLATAVGMAMAEAHLAARYNRPGHCVVNHFTYVLASDGDMMEGVASEAVSLAGHLRLGKLVCLYDSNDISLDGGTALCFSEDVARRFEACGWHTLRVDDGNSLERLSQAIGEAQAETRRPSLIVVRTKIGYGSPGKQGSAKAHGSPLGAAEVVATRRNLGWPEEGAFVVPDEALSRFRTAIEAGSAAQAEWSARFAAWAQAFPDLAAEWRAAFSCQPPEGWDENLPTFGPEDSAATRATGSKVLNAIAPRYPALFGGSADLNSSTNTVMKGLGDFESPEVCGRGVEGAVGEEWSYQGRNVHFGVREHAMAAAANGIALHGGLRPYVSTFFTFADYLKPALRLSALMELPVIYVFTHDSIALGEDGPTHQPVEQLAMLRALPNLVVIRPADAAETAEAWKVAIERLDGPTALLLTRQKVPALDRTIFPSAAGLRYGAYVLREATGGNPALVLIATGSEVAIALAAQELLQAQGVPTRVVSMPSWELFDQQPASYRETVLPPDVKRVAIEAGSSLGWHKYVGDGGAVVALDHFGASAPAEVLLREFGFTPANVVQVALGLLGRS